MYKIMAVNAGSSSLKFQLLEMPEETVIVNGVVEKINPAHGISSYTFKVDGKKVLQGEQLITNHEEAVKIVLEKLISGKFISSLTEIVGVGHRVVQGGTYFNGSCLVDDDVKNKIKELIPLAPLHNGANLTGITAFEKALPEVQNVVVFDTAFHQTIPAENYLYGAPYEWYTKYKVRKYGAHGTSHQYVAQVLADILGKDMKDLKIITCHIGNGASITAIKGGKSLDTSMGLTPLDGFPMGTRSGHMDPAILSYMQKQTNLSLDQLIDICNKGSGYLGISGYSQDSRDLENAILKAKEATATDEEKELGRRCRLAFDVQIKRICDYIGSYYVLMEGCDALVFTAGIGENSATFREGVCRRLEFLGVKIDYELNANDAIRGLNAKISTDSSKVAVYILPTNEELVIARDVMNLIKLK